MYFFTEFERTVERAEALMVKRADEERPFDFKYEAREMLQAMEIPADHQFTHAAKGILEYLIGCNHFETEEVGHSE
jgi:tetratricopeptide (TPR) repeat protein